MWDSVDEDSQLRIGHSNIFLTLIVTSVIGWWVGFSMWGIHAWTNIVFGSFMLVGILIYIKDCLAYFGKKNKTVSQITSFIRDSLLQIIIMSSCAFFIAGIFKLLKMIYRGAPIQDYWQGI